MGVVGMMVVVGWANLMTGACVLLLKEFVVAYQQYHHRRYLPTYLPTCCRCCVCWCLIISIIRIGCPANSSGKVQVRRTIHLNVSLLQEEEEEKC